MKVRESLAKIPGDCTSPSQTKCVESLHSGNYAASLMVIEAEVISHHLSLMIDTGAEINLLADALRQNSNLAFPTQHAQVNIHGADGRIFQSSWVVTLAIRFFSPQ